MNAHPPCRRLFTLVCAWCGRLLGSHTLEGPGGDRLSHGICDACRRKVLQEITR